MKSRFRKQLRAKTIQLIRLSRSISIEKLLRYSLITVIIGNLAIVGAIAIQLSRDAQQKSARELQEERALAIAQKVRTHLDDLQQQLSYLQKVRGLAALPDRVQHSLLEGLTRENNAYETIAIVSRQGEVLAAIAPYSADNAAEIVLASIQKPDLAEAIREQVRYIDRVEFDEDLKVPMTTLVLPIQDRDGRPQGVLVAAINLDFLNAIVARSQIGKTGYVYIVDRHNRIIARKLSAAEAYQDINLDTMSASDGFANLSVRALIQRINSNLSDSARLYRGLRGVNVLGTSSLVYGVNWRVVVELPLREVYAPVRRLIVVMGVVLAIAIAVAILLSIKMARSLISPLESLTKAANYISRGEFSTRVTLKHRNEWGILASAFNYMTARIQRSFKALEAKNNELAETLEALQKTQLQLVQTEKMSGLGQLVAGVAHEINNPMNFIHGNLVHAEEYAESLLELISLYQHYYPDPNIEIKDRLEEADLDFLQADFPKLVQSMKMGSKRVREIVTSLRSFSRLDESSFKEVDIHEGLENTLVILQNQIKAKSDRCEIKIVKNYGNLPLVECYPAQLNQVFMNLLNNAIDALDRFRQKDSDRQPEIAIATEWTKSTSATPDKNTTISIRIADNGEGIPDEVKKRIFNPFFTTKPIGKGTGLGLSISYQIITETHQGTLECFSTAGQGTVFQIEIPCQTVHTLQH